MTGFQASRIVVRDRKLRQANSALSEANKELFGLNRDLDGSNQALKNEIAERERAEAERAKLDVQLQHLRYLYRLRSTLGTAQSGQDVIRRSGKALMEVLGAVDSAGVVIEHDRRSWSFGNTVRDGRAHYNRPLYWGGRERGRLHLFSGVALSESQERALLDETAGQISRVLEARELEMQIVQSARLVSLGEMAAGMAHEIYQPLSVISTISGDVYLRLLEGIELPRAQLKRMMKTVMDLVKRMAGTIDHLRVFSRDTSKEPEVRFCVNDAIHSSLKLIGAQLESHRIRLKLDLSEGLPPVSGHPNRMEQVFLNLLSNARDALNERSERDGDGNGAFEKRLTVRTRCETYGIGWVIVEVEDNGIGIEAGNMERLFDPFFTTKEAGKGTGLGLSISYGILQNHRGRISCENRNGEGTLFRVALPAAEEA